MTGIDRTNVAGAAAQSDAATIYVCITCRRAEEPEADPRPGALLAAATATAAQGSAITVREVRCLANCTRGPSACAQPMSSPPKTPS